MNSLKALGLEDLTHGGGAQGELLLFESLTDFIHGMVLLAQRDEEGAGGGLLGLGTRSGAGGDEEGGVGVAPEGVAEHAEGTRRIAEGASGLVGGPAVDIIGPECLVLPLFGLLRLEEEAARVR